MEGEQQPGRDLSVLAEELIQGLAPRKLAPASVESYRFDVNRIVQFARDKGRTAYYPELPDEYTGYLDQRLKDGTIVKNTRNRSLRTMRMLVSLAETGEMDFTRKPQDQQLYILSGEGEKLVHDILEYSDIPGISRYRIMP